MTHSHADQILALILLPVGLLVPFAGFGLLLLVGFVCDLLLDRIRK